MPILIAGAALLLLACSTHAGAPTAQAPSRPTLAPAAASKKPRSARLLPDDARFVELLSLAQRRLDERDATAQDGCLLARDSTGLRLSADLLSAFDPIPQAPPSLEAFAERPEARVMVLDAFGRHGATEGRLVLAPFTTSPPLPGGTPLLALLLGVEGTSLRYSDRDAQPADDQLQGDALVARLLTTASPQAMLYVTAEAGTPVRELYALLSRLPRRPTALAVALPLGTRPPPPAAVDDSAHCPDGLPEIAEDAPLGDLDPARLGEALAALRQSAGRCLESAPGGGRLTLALRIEAGGRVAHSCVMQAASSSGLLATCLTESARLVPFPAPEPPGVVDLHVPLDLSPAGIAPQYPVCL